jgi:hypothetical protein
MPICASNASCCSTMRSPLVTAMVILSCMLMISLE